MDTATTLKVIKDALDIFVTFVGLPSALLAAYFAYRRWFKPAALGVALDSIVFIPPRVDPAVTTKQILIAAQIRFFNAGAFPESIAEISLFDLTVSLNGKQCTFAAYAFLKPLKMCEKKEHQDSDKLPSQYDKPPEFKIEADELAHSFFLPGGQQIPLNLLFIPDRGQSFTPKAGNVRLEFKIKAKTAAGKAMEFPPLIRFREIDDEEAQMMQSGNFGWLSWHLREELH